jgi:hypothetical protein
VMKSLKRVTGIQAVNLRKIPGLQLEFLSPQ